MHERRSRGIGPYWLVLGLLAVGGLVAKGDDPTPEEQARRALDVASALDTEAQRARNLEVSRAKWFQAAQEIDKAVRSVGDNPAAPPLRFQAAVYLWARARSRLDEVDLLDPSDSTRREVARELDDVVDRLRGIRLGDDLSGPLGPNVRFRLAQALSDRSRLRADDDPLRVASIREAQALLERLGDNPRLRTFARLLHAELAIRLGLAIPAQLEVEAIEKLDPPAPAVSLLDVRINSLIARDMFADATRLTNQATAPAEQKGLWRLRILLARRRQAALGPDREPIETEAFEVARSLRASDRPEVRRALRELARGIEQPPQAARFDAWDLLADGCLLLAEADRAGSIASRGADRATASGDSSAASALRFKAGAAWFQANKLAEADRILTRVADDAAAPRTLRARAGMLRALVRGQALTNHQPGASRAAYLTALEDQVRDFPMEAASGEARWLLGKIRQIAGRRDEAIALWSGVGHGQARWLEAQMAAADEAIRLLEEQWVNRDLAAVRPRFDQVRAMIQAALDQAAEGPELVQMQLRLGWLHTIPGLGQPAEAVAVLDRLLRGPASAEQHRQAQLTRLVGLAEQNRFGEAEAVTRSESRSEDLAPLWPAIRRLDQLASTTDGDLARRRVGVLIRTLLDRWVDPPDRAPVADRDEVILRHARGVLFAGDATAARRELARWGGPSEIPSDLDLLRDLGDIYFRLETYPLAADVERLRAGKLPPGSPAWFGARYNLALALFRSNRRKEAQQVVEGTAILHPSLGGGETRLKFDRLSQKLNAQ